VKEKLAAAIAELAPKQRMVVELHLLHGLGFRKIAPMIGSTDEAARRNYSHAVKKLREILLPDG
jgi:RNA polymerase sigma factor (sigma-70 family)